jgi:tRNA-dihydrouridine synthase
VPVIGNGDVTSPVGYRRMLEATGCDAVMIGRGAIGNPWIFARIAALEAGRADPGPPSPAERRAVLLAHADLIRRLEPERPGVELRRLATAYTRGARGASGLRRRIWTELDPEAALAEAARVLGERELSDPGTAP